MVIVATLILTLLLPACADDGVDQTNGTGVTVAELTVLRTEVQGLKMKSRDWKANLQMK